jgi:hypothetical protein
MLKASLSKRGYDMSQAGKGYDTFSEWLNYGSKRPFDNPDMVGAPWDDILKAAEQYNALGACTAFIGCGLMDISNIAGRQPKEKSIGTSTGRRSFASWSRHERLGGGLSRWEKISVVFLIVLACVVRARYCERPSSCSANAFYLISPNVNCGWHASQALTRPTPSTSGRYGAQRFSFWMKRCSCVSVTCFFLGESNPAGLNVWTELCFPLRPCVKSWSMP